MDYRLDHIGLLCQDLERSLGTYTGGLGNALTSRWYSRGILDLAFVGSGCDTTVELVGPPFLSYEDEHILRHGYSPNHVSYLVYDADASFEELSSQGVRVAWEPQDMLMMRQCGFLDEDGLLFEVFSYLSPLHLASPDMSAPPGPADLRLHHISILTPDLRRSQRFYAEKLGLRTLFEYVEDDGGFVFLVDPFFNLDDHCFMLEIIGPPHLEPREARMLQQRGACFDHVCYCASDVSGAWRATIERGAENMAEPVHEYGMWIAWVRDADGNDVEIMNPMPDALVEMALQGDQPIDLTAL